ncbi:MAG TPA: CrcB family protein [Nocardioidaceae bacterium]|nr:CrcB family protein [Nocardioidaceae bacterium]
MILVAVGAAVGAPLRYLAASLLDARLPWGTLAVNWAGSFLLGCFSGLGLSGAAMALLGTGFCGGLTTYSAFAVQTRDLGPRRGALNVVLTVVPVVLLCSAGFAVGAGA